MYSMLVQITYPGFAQQISETYYFIAIFSTSYICDQLYLVWFLISFVYLFYLYTLSYYSY